ncbi:MAG: glycosyltransferase family 4 protein, partial [Desulfobacterales bacterium]
AEKLQVISNGADLDRFNPQIDKQRVIKKHKLQGSVVVGFVGSFHYWHGVENLTKLIEGTLASQPNSRFLMVGEGGPMKPRLEAFIRDKGLQDRVILTGHISHDQVPEYISAMDIVLAPYPKLDFFYYSPVKVYEYLACGKPVVTTKIGQISQVIQDKKNGFLCEPDDVNGMQERISELAASPSLRVIIGEAAYQTIVEQHSWKKKAKQLSDICHQVLSNHKNGGN